MRTSFCMLGTSSVAAHAWDDVEEDDDEDEVVEDDRAE